MFTAELRRTPSGPKKFVVVINGTRTIRFGQLGASDYTLHKDFDRMVRYLRRHARPEDFLRRGLRSLDDVRSSKEDWDDIFTAGFWSRWLLWSRPGLKAAKAFMARRFGIRFV